MAKQQRAAAGPEPVVHGGWLERIGNGAVVAVGLLVWGICVVGVIGVGLDVISAAGRYRAKHGRGGRRRFKTGPAAAGANRRSDERRI